MSPNLFLLDPVCFFLSIASSVLLSHFVCLLSLGTACQSGNPYFSEWTLILQMLIDASV